MRNSSACRVQCPLFFVGENTERRSRCHDNVLVKGAGLRKPVAVKLYSFYLRNKSRK